MNFYSVISPNLNEIQGQIISVIGGGGKSTLLEKLANELVSQDMKVILTTTTKTQPLPGVKLLLHTQNPKFLNELESALDEEKLVVLASEFYKGGPRLNGLRPHLFFELVKYADVILVEADGSRQRSLKTHKIYEPVIPPLTTTVIIVCGASIVGEKLDENNVHRAELFSQKWKLPFGTILTPEIIAGELLSPEGYLRNIPLKSKVSFLINKSDENPIGGKLLAEHLMTKCQYPIFLSSLKTGALSRVAPETVTK